MEEQKNIVETVLKAGRQLAELKLIPESMHEETRVLVPEGLRLELLKTQTSPARKKGSKSFLSVKSFCEYVNKHKMQDKTVIIADESKGAIKAIFNDHGPETPGFSDFSASLDLGFSKQFKTWIKNSFNENEHKFSQADFADFIEDNRSDLMVGDFETAEKKVVKNISALQLTDLINNLEISSNETVVSKRNPATGEVTYSYDLKESGKQEFKLPSSIFLATPVYKHGDLFRIELRLRSSRGAEPKFWYIIDNLELLKEKAFGKICKRIKLGFNFQTEKKSDDVIFEGDPEEQFTGTGLEVWKGTF